MERLGASAPDSEWLKKRRARENRIFDRNGSQLFLPDRGTNSSDASGAGSAAPRLNN
jgi:hypothetical protein